MTKEVGTRQYADKSVKWVDKMSLTSSSMDFILILPVLMLAATGCMFIFSFTAHNKLASPFHYFSRHLLLVLLGICLMYLLSRIDYHLIATMLPYIYGFSLVLSFIASIIKSDDCTRGFLQLWELTINTPQLLVFTTILMVAKTLAAKELSLSRAFFIVSGFGVLPCIFLGMSYALSTAIVLVLVCVMLFFIKRPIFTIVTTVCTVALILVSILYSPNRDFLLGRIAVWMNPFKDSMSYGYSTVQSLYAIASGGLFGVGIGNGNAKFLVPNITTDYIFSGIVQEIGLVGALLVLLLFFLLIWRAALITNKTPDKLGFYLSAAVMIHLGVLTALHVSVVTNLVPSIGVSLPFLSYDGTSILFDYFYIGILLNVSRSRTTKFSGDCDE